jgi:hypothetical protein
MDILTEHINILIPHTNEHGVDIIWIVVGEDVGMLGVLDGVCTSYEDAHDLALEVSTKNPDSRYWIQQVALTGPALERTKSVGGKK